MKINAFGRNLQKTIGKPKKPIINQKKAERVPIKQKKTIFSDTSLGSGRCFGFFGFFGTLIAFQKILKQTPKKALCFIGF